jgi:hypothetical protein
VVARPTNNIDNYSRIFKKTVLSFSVFCMSHLWVDFDEDVLFRVDKDLQEASFVERTVDEGEKLLMLKEENVRGRKRGKEAKDRASVCVCVRMWNVCVYGCSPKRHRLESAKPPEVWNIEPRTTGADRAPR